MKRRVHISQKFNLGEKGHIDYEFVDVAINDDVKLFLDPCLIELSEDEWGIKANKLINSFFGQLFEAYRNDDDVRIMNLLSYAGEQNGTRLGYGRGNNGKGNTPEGLAKILLPMKKMIADIQTISKPLDVPLLIVGFAEDGMSDLITNILHTHLTDYTIDILGKCVDIEVKDRTFSAWNIDLMKWEKVRKKSILVDGKEILLVPKNIVRKQYLFSTSQYFSRIVLERMREEGEYTDINGKKLSKKEVLREKRFSGDHWQYKENIDYSTQHNDVLQEYHEKISGFYLNNGGPMSDEQLDEVVYGDTKNKRHM